MDEQERRREIRKRKKRRRQRAILLRALTGLFVLVLVFGLVRGPGFFAARGWFFRTADKDLNAVSYVDEQAAELDYPKVYEGGKIRKKLEGLAAGNADYQKIIMRYDEYPEKLLASLCSNEELLSFVLGYLSSDKKAHGSLTDKELSADIPQFQQWDARWGYVPYGDDDIALSGCAPTCLSMAIVALTGDANATPDVVAGYAEDAGYYLPGTGTSWALMTEGCRHFGITGRELGLDENAIRNRLLDGNPIICSMRPGDFTTSGHFIVLTGVKDDKIIVHDPNSKKRSEVLWSYETLSTQIKNLWVFTAGE